MALPTTLVWEVDNTGTAEAAANGGGFDPSCPSAGTDYSLRDNSPGGNGGPILAPTDLAMAAASTTLTSAIGGFTAAMVANNIRVVSGTNFVAGWYNIRTYVNGNTVTLDRTAVSGGTGSSGVGNVGGCLDLPSDAPLEAGGAAGGNVFFVKGGSGVTYTLGAAVTLAASGTSALPNLIIGYNATRALYGVCDTTDRPTIAGAANTFTFPDYWQFYNLILTTTATLGWVSGLGNYLQNCKSTQSGAATRYAWYSSSTYGRAVDCEFASTSGWAVYVWGSAARLFACYIHDSVKGFVDWISLLVGCIIEGCSTSGLEVSVGTAVINCTIDGCGDGIVGGDYANCLFLNDIISNCSSEGAVWSSQLNDNQWDYCNWHNNGAVATNVAKRNSGATLPGPHDTAEDPAYPGAGDYSTGAAMNDGLGPRMAVG